MQLTLPQAKTLQQIANIVDAQLVGDSALGGIAVFSIATIDVAQRGSLSFLANPRYKKYLATTQASAVILEQEYAALSPVPCLVTKNARLSLAKLLQLCENARNGANPKANNIHPSAVIDPSVELGNGLQIGAGVVIGANCKVGDNCVLKPNVTLYPGVTLGKNCSIHSGTVIGSDGFGYAMDDQYNWVKMPHLGGVVIGDNVEIGSNTCIDRGVLDNTEIGRNVIIDNLVQIGHNVIIGDHTAIAGCVGIAGSTTIGKYCMLGGAACIGGHLEIADRVHITGTSAVNSSIDKPGVYSSGLPARENSVWRRNVARFMTLESMAKRIKQLEKAIANEQEYKA